MSMLYPNSDERPTGAPGVGLPAHLRVYTNRNLRMESIEAIGFDMDHTLALYDHHVFEQLCFEMAIDLLVTDKGYPETIRETAYDRTAIARGLIVDKRQGHILKVQHLKGRKKLLKEYKLWLEMELL